MSKQKQTKAANKRMNERANESGAKNERMNESV